jgi:GR25 family glycosyltransferase involved in LPS biosynthesis
MNPFYSYFDDIICISLKERVDRQELAKSQGEKMGIPFRFYLTEKDPRGGLVGCFKSHFNVIKEAYASGKNSIMILEDDFCPSPAYSDKNHLANALKFLTGNNEWETLQLGYSPLQDIDKPLGIFKFLTSEYVYPSIIKYVGLCTHCYCMSKIGMKRFIDYTDNFLKNNDYIHFDKLFCDVFDKQKAYCVVPLLIDQKWCLPTDNIAVTENDKFARKFQCSAETYKLFYYISLLVVYRVYIVISIAVIILMICMRKKNKS